MTGVSKISNKEMKDVAKIISNSKLKELKILYIFGDSKCGMTKTKDFLPDLMKITTQQIYLDNLVLGEEDLATIFKNATNVKELCLVNCQISNIGKDFEISSKQKYKMQTLDLFYTCVQDSDKYLNEKKLTALLEEIEKTKLPDTLRTLHVCSADFDKDDLSDILNDHETGMKLKLDSKQPDTLD